MYQCPLSIKQYHFILENGFLNKINTTFHCKCFFSQMCTKLCAYNAVSGAGCSRPDNCQVVSPGPAPPAAALPLITGPGPLGPPSRRAMFTFTGGPRRGPLVYTRLHKRHRIADNEKPALFFAYSLPIRVCTWKSPQLRFRWSLSRTCSLKSSTISGSIDHVAIDLRSTIGH